MCSRLTLVFAVIGVFVVVCFAAVMFCVLSNAVSYALWKKYIF
jgi:hypothetical protein